MASHGTQVQHIEGTSYVVAFGDPARYPILGSNGYSINSFPAAGGENPYQPETRLLAVSNANLVRLGESKPPVSLIMQIGNSLCVPIYDALRCVPERSRGLGFEPLLDAAESNQEFKRFTNWMVNYNRRAGPIGIASLITCLFICFYRMCHRDGTLQICTKTPEEATRSDPNMFDFDALYFNLSPRERRRLREYAKRVRRDRRMPYVLSRQLILRKASRGGGPSGRFIRRNFLPDSDELFRVVVSFL
jgi:hypothetical protein